MDTERLTPHLRRRVLRLSVQDRLALNAEIVRSLSALPPAAQLETLRHKMLDLSGVDVCEKTRLRSYVEARMVFAYVGRMKGYSQSELAGFLHFDHSTVCTMQRSMGRAFMTPRAYADVINLYNQYTKEIL